jgi:carboxypeptidase Q
MFQKQKIAFVLLLSLVMPGLAIGHTGSAERSAVDRIRDEGMNRSQAMATMKYLSDVIGARLTNSPAQLRANKWTKEQLETWGMKNGAVDPWGEFGRGWELKRFTASVVAGEEFIAFRAYPKAWSPSTNGAITGAVVYVDATDEAGLEKYKGKLKGAIVITAPEREVKPGFAPVATRVSDQELARLENIQPQPQQAAGQGGRGGGQGGAQSFNQRKLRFYFEEGVAVLVEPSMGTDSGTIRVMGAMPAPQAAADGGGQPASPFGGMRVYSKDAPPTIPQLVAETEQYNRLYRLVKQGIPVKMTVDIAVQFFDGDLQGYNTIAEIPGTDLADEVVMVGAHLDSWHSGNGSTDNGAGTTVAMEAMRILAATGMKPRRTIRIGLWTGEEQGLLGSRGYVARNFAELEAAPPGTPMSERKLITKPGYDKFSAYYNLDNGTGQIRGINMQGNEQLRPIFREFLGPFADLGASTVSVQSVGGTDHQAFDGVGLPGFQFIQDPIEYNGRTWHTTQDVADRTIEEDLKRSAVIMAAFAYNTAMMDGLLPRKSSPNAAIASLLSNFDLMALNDEAAVRSLGFGFEVCGFDLTFEELPNGFPAFLTLSTSFHGHSTHAD